MTIATERQPTTREDVERLCIEAGRIVRPLALVLLGVDGTTWEYDADREALNRAIDAAEDATRACTKAHEELVQLSENVGGHAAEGEFSDLERAVLSAGAVAGWLASQLQTQGKGTSYVAAGLLRGAYEYRGALEGWAFYLRDWYTYDRANRWGDLQAERLEESAGEVAHG